MAGLETVPVGGQFAWPDGTKPTNTTIRFTLNQYDTDSAEGFTIIPKDDLFFTLGDEGVLNADLWPNEDGENATFYTVTSVTRNAYKCDTLKRLGRMIVPNGSGPYNANALISAFSDTLGEDWGSVADAPTNYANYGNI